MATLPQLIDVFAKHDGRDHSTLTQFGRVTRESGFIPGGKRGRGAPHMTSANTATLLLGIYGSASPKDAPDTITRLSTLRPFDVSDDAGIPEALSEIGKAATFGEALEEAIISAPDLAVMCADYVQQARNGKPLSDKSRNLLVAQAIEGRGVVRFRVEIAGLSAEMSLTSPWGKTHWKARYAVDDELFTGGFYSDPSKFDRRVSVTFGLPTLISLFECLTGFETTE